MEIQYEFNQRFRRRPEYLVRAPGRVNLIGEHVDYNQGPVLPAALDLTLSIAAAPVEDERITLLALDLNEQVSFNLDELDHKVDIAGKDLPAWARYPAGVAWALKMSDHPVKGMQAAIHSNIPIGAGLSSSAAIEVGFGVLWQALGDWEMERMELARLCQLAENQYIGVSCGLMDQFTSACGVEGHALYFDTRSLEWEPVPLLADTCIVVIDSGVKRSLTNTAYNQRHAECEMAVDLLRKYLPNILSLRDVSPIELAAYSEYLPETIRKRAEHVVREIARVDSAVQALRREDGRALGALLYASHTSLKDLYEVSHPALDNLVEMARELPGCLGARLTGAGFGGCTVNVVEREKAEAFASAIEDKYLNKTGVRAKVYLCQPSQGASVEKI